MMREIFLERENLGITNLDTIRRNHSKYFAVLHNLTGPTVYFVINK